MSPVISYILTYLPTVLFNPSNSKMDSPIVRQTMPCLLNNENNISFFQLVNIISCLIVFQFNFGDQSILLDYFSSCLGWGYYCLVNFTLYVSDTRGAINLHTTLVPITYMYILDVGHYIAQ